MLRPRNVRRLVVLGRPPFRERRIVLEALRAETVGGALLMIFAVAALIWANSPWKHAYEDVRDASFGIASLHLKLTVEHWAADGLLAVFFFVAGIELKRELVVGELRRLSAAILPVVAAFCGMVLPVAVFFAVTHGAEGSGRGWAIPTATDIAFALAVLAVTGQHLPSALRAFLLTLAVVDDLGAIIIIATFYTSHISLWPLLGGIALLVVFWSLQRMRVSAWWIYTPVALVTWALIHASGVHATVAGVAMGLLMRVNSDAGEKESPGERAEHRMRPVSAGIAVPIFALFAAGVTVSTADLDKVFTDRLALGVVLGLFAGKALGIFGGTYAVARFTKAELSSDLEWGDIFAVAVLAGVGFTVSLLIGQLAFAGNLERLNLVKLAVLVGSLLSALTAALLLRRRNRWYQALED